MFFNNRIFYYKLDILETTLKSESYIFLEKFSHKSGASFRIDDSHDLKDGFVLFLAFIYLFSFSFKFEENATCIFSKEF